MKKHLDQFDLEAEIEGIATKQMNILCGGKHKCFAHEAKRSERFFVKRLSEVSMISKGAK
jgi:hypothetical protein